MANKIQIKRSTTTAITSSSPALSQGELAFTQNGNNFFIGAPDGSSGNFRIGHVLNDGILTANQAMVANSTGGINKVITSNLVIGSITANGALGDGVTALVLTSNSSGGVYWGPPAFDATKQYTFTNTISFTNTVTFTQTVNATSNNSLNLGGVGLSTIQTYITTNAAAAYANAQSWVTAQAYVNTAQLTSNLALYTNTANLAANYTNNAQLAANLALYQTSAGLAANVATLAANSANYLNGVGASSYSANVNGGLIQNSSGHFVNANNGIIANSSGVFVNANTTSGGLIANSTGVFVVANTNSGLFTNSSGLYVNTSYVSSYATNALTVGGNSAGDLRTFANAAAAQAYTNATSYADTASANAYTWAMANTQSRNGSYSGNNVFNGSLTTFNSNVAITSGSYITTDLVPTPNTTNNLGTLNNRWKTLFVSNVTVGNATITVDSSNNVNINNLYSNNFIANNAAINYVTSNAVFTGANIVFSGTQTINALSANIYANFISAGGLSVAGDLVVAGTVTTVDATTLVVNTAQIEVAANNTVGDVLDYGVYGSYYSGGSNSYSGIARLGGSSDTNPVWQIYSSKVKPGTNITPTYQGTLQAYIKPYLGSGGFVANSTNVNITANGVIGVAIAANSLTLTTALGVASGGTGYTSYNQGDFLYASGSSTLSTLSIGTAGQVLMVSASGIPQWAGLDAGTF